MRSAVRRALFVVAAGAAIVACSLTTDLTGFSYGPTDGPDASGIEASVPDVVSSDAPTESAPPPCKASTVIDTPLGSDLASWSARANGAAGYPKVETFFGTSAAVLFPFVDTTPVPIDAGDPDAGPTFYNPPERTASIAALWQLTPVPLQSFDVELDAQLRCTKSGSCADGLAFAWLDTTLTGALDDKNAGGAQGIPGGVRGAAVLLDDYRNELPEIPDPPAPSLQVVKLDPTKTPGTYDWVVASQPASFLGAWHTVAISVRAGAVTVRLDGKVTVSASVTPVVRGLVGLTAGTGGQTDAVAVRNFKGSFYDCTP